MTNRTVIRNLCNAIVNTFYPDMATIDVMLFNEDIEGDDAPEPKDPTLFRIAVRLVKGYVEKSRNENGLSTAVNEDAVNSSIRFWCGEYGLDADEVLGDSVRVIEDGSNLW